MCPLAQLAISEFRKNLDHYPTPDGGDQLAPATYHTDHRTPKIKCRAYTYFRCKAGTSDRNSYDRTLDASECVAELPSDINSEIREHLAKRIAEPAAAAAATAR